MGLAGTKFWSLRLHFFTKMGSSHKGTWFPGLVAGTSRRDQLQGPVAGTGPLVCADLKGKLSG